MFTGQLFRDLSRRHSITFLPAFSVNRAATSINDDLPLVQVPLFLGMYLGYYLLFEGGFFLERLEKYSRGYPSGNSMPVA